MKVLKQALFPLMVLVALKSGPDLINGTDLGIK